MKNKKVEESVVEISEASLKQAEAIVTNALKAAGYEVVRWQDGSHSIVNQPERLSRFAREVGERIAVNLDTLKGVHAAVGDVSRCAREDHKRFVSLARETVKIAQDRQALIDLILTGMVQKIVDDSGDRPKCTEPRLSKEAREAVRVLERERNRALDSVAMKAAKRVRRKK